MIQLNPTQDGLRLIAANQGLTFTRFLAGSGRDASDSCVQNVRQEVLIAHSVSYLAGNTYIINGIEQTIDYNSIKLTGVLQTSQAEQPYNWTELALMALDSNNAEVTVAYGTAAQAVYNIDPSVSDSYVINFELIFADTPHVTVQTTAAGITWTDFLAHANSNISSGAHGLRFENNQIYINDIPMNYLQTQELLAISGIDSILNAFPVPNAAWLGKTVLNRNDQSLKRLIMKEELSAGHFIYQAGNVWIIGSGAEEGSLLVVSDDAIPSSNEIKLSDAQVYFMEWQDVKSLSERIADLEQRRNDNSICLSQPDTAFNSEWISRMTGSGTEASPYLIYTPYDFNKIREKTSAVYRILNNLDFTEVIGIELTTEGGVLMRGSVDENAPLYNAGSGFNPIDSFSGVIDGNGHIIKGLTSCGSSAKGIVNNLNGGKIQNLILKDGYLVNTLNTNGEVYMGAFAGVASSTSYITNCINYNAVMSTANNSNARVHIGGILGRSNSVSNNNTVIRFCANHGSLYNDSLNGDGCVCGIIGDCSYTSSSSQIIIDGCSNTASLRGVNVSGITRSYNNITLSPCKIYITNCYSSGIITASSECCAIVNSKIADCAAQISSCYGREGFGSHNKAEAVSFDFMQSYDFVELLNRECIDSVYLYDDINSNNGLPMLSFEYNLSAGIDGDLSLALLNSYDKSLSSSKFTFNKIKNLAEKQDIKNIRAAMPKVIKAELISSAWTEQNGSYNQSIICSDASTDSTVLLIPQSSDSFTYGLTVSCAADKNLTFTASSQPSANICTGVIIF